MTGMSSISIGLALLALTILAVVLLIKLRARSPKRPEPWEKAAIMKKLLELSEQDGFPTRAVPVRSRPVVSNKTLPTSSKHLRAAPKAARAKVR